MDCERDHRRSPNTIDKCVGCGAQFAENCGDYCQFWWKSWTIEKHDPTAHQRVGSPSYRPDNDEAAHHPAQHDFHLKGEMFLLANSFKKMHRTLKSNPPFVFALPRQWWCWWTWPRSSFWRRKGCRRSRSLWRLLGTPRLGSGGKTHRIGRKGWLWNCWMSSQWDKPEKTECVPSTYISWSQFCHE